MNTLLSLYNKLSHVLSKNKVNQLRFTALSAIFCSIFEVAPLLFIPYILDESQFTNSSNLTTLILPIIKSQTHAILYFCLVTIISIAFRYAYYLQSQRISYIIANEFQSKALSTLLTKGFNGVSKQNNAELFDLLTNQVNLIGVCVNYLLVFVSGCTTSSIFIIALLFFDPKSTIALTIIVGLSYIFANALVKPILSKNSKTKLQKSLYRATKIENIICMYRELTIEGLLNPLKTELSNLDLGIRRLQFQDQSLGIFPKYLIEGVAIVSLLIIAISNENGSGSTTLTLAAYVFSMQRLLPSAQQMFSAKSEINSYASSVNAVIKMIDISYLLNNGDSFRQLTGTANNGFKNLILKGITFNHTDQLLIENLSFKLNSGDWLAVIGPTGSGKSTLLNLMMGFIQPKTGTIKFNNNEFCIPNDMKLWHNMISFVPQDPYLYDSSMLYNITYKSNYFDIDQDKLQKSVFASCLNDFCDVDLLDKFQCSYNGAALSGGQRQRIALARALYRDKPILFLDEFTSALDELTESKILRNLNIYYPRLSVVMVSHRKQPLEACNFVIPIKSH